MVQGGAEDWVSRMADDVVERAAGGRIVCASGISPSGPIHLGNLREVMTPHLVADEIRRRGHECVHILSWDDYDRYRRVPAGFDPAWSEHIGKPLTSVPAPAGSPHPNWAEHFKAPMAAALAELGVEFHGISQTAAYTSGAYRDRILLAMRERARIDAILSRYRTKRAEPDEDDDEDPAAASYYPYRPYCSVCDRDLTTVTHYDDETTELSYTCACGHAETVLLNRHDRGKLVWKVDWPMRWAHEGVTFEPSGVDHSSPGSSFQVGGQIVAEVFGGEQPIGPMYAFVGISGMAKMSSSKGDVPTASDALEIMEPSLLRWLYARRKPNQSFKIAFDKEIHRVYDEWDALARRAGSDAPASVETTAYDRAVRTAAGPLPATPRPVPYGVLVSLVDITTDDDEQLLRILRSFTPEDPITSLAQARPRLDRARAWVRSQLPEDERTRVRAEPDTELLAGLDEPDRESLRLLLKGLDENWSQAGLTALVYGVPKIRMGLPADTRPTPELKTAQRQFFVLLYRLLVGGDTGPRLPTLLLAAGPDTVRRLVSV